MAGENLAGQPHIAAIHDISCVGRCSLTVALPVLSAAGIETSILPTAILSTHTGGFQNYTYRDLTADILPIARHWKSLNLCFDAIYTGFLGSFEQLTIVRQVFDLFSDKRCLRFVDPVMADHGRLYQSFQQDYIAGMADFCRSADVITPNITEAVFMLGMPYRPGPYSEQYITDLLKRLAEFGNRYVVLTGVHYDQAHLGAAAYHCETDTFSYAFSSAVAGCYYGSGDVFASTLLAGLLNNLEMEEALRIAVDFTATCIRSTRTAGIDVRYGLNFEGNLPVLMESLGKFKK